jgi:hypothetical protein
MNSNPETNPCIPNPHFSPMHDQRQTHLMPYIQPRDVLDPSGKGHTIPLSTLELPSEPRTEPSLFHENDLSTSILNGTFISTGGSGLFKSADVSFLLWPGLESDCPTSVGGLAAADASTSSYQKVDKDSSLAAFFLAARGSVTSLADDVPPTRRGMYRPKNGFVAGMEAHIL